MIEMRGPVNKFQYEANLKSELAMIAGGTGITPMLQIIKEIIKNPQDRTKVHLIFANHSEKDILLKEELDSIARNSPNLNITYVVSSPESSWKGITGRINEDILQKILPRPSKDVMILVCGPPSFMETISGNRTVDKKQGILSGILKKMGFDEENVLKL
jgi:cytochrome-b5 reductase